MATSRGRTSSPATVSSVAPSSAGPATPGARPARTCTTRFWSRGSRSTRAPTCGTDSNGGLEGPPSPHARKRPGGAVALLEFARHVQGLEGPPSPHARKRPGGAVALLEFARHVQGLEGPPSPRARKRPGGAVALLEFAQHVRGLEGPPSPRARKRPGGAVALLEFARRVRGLEKGPQAPALGSAPAEPWRSSNSHGVSGASKRAPKPPMLGSAPAALLLRGRARDEVQAQRVEHVGALEEIAVPSTGDQL